MKSRIFFVLIALVVGFTGGIFFEKYSDVLTGWLPNSFVAENDDSSSNQKDPTADWGVISNGLGFSLKYPYKDAEAVFSEDRYSSVTISFLPEGFSKDKQVAENLRADVSEMKLVHQLDISNPNPMIFLIIKDDFLSWIKTSLQNDLAFVRNDEKVLSEQTTPTVFAGEPAYLVVRQIEKVSGGNTLHYTRKDTFVKSEKNENVFRISQISASDDSSFLRSGSKGKEFLEYIDARSSDILKTFIFDRSIKDSAIVLPKTPLPKLTGKAAENREKLLSTLRQGPFFDEKQAYQAIPPEQRCPYENMNFFLDDFVAGEKGVAELDIFDEKGNHHGALPVANENFVPLITDSVYGVTWFIHDQSANNRRLSFAKKDANQKIGVIGKKFSTTKLSIRNVGETCQNFEAIVPTTPYSIATMTVNQGNISPISYDVDGDGVEDLQLSPIHPLFPEKKAQLEAVLADMKAVEGKIK